ncbi:MAG: hypothetical protein P1V81_14485 [Planctomycetota bacterium]|nr:hypothetical protein [Planctomycetota bacterium]
MISVFTILVLAVALLAGHLVLGLTGAFAGRGQLERQALAALAGLSVLAFLVTLLGLAGPLSAGAAWSLTVALAAGGAWGLWRQLRSRAPGPTPATGARPGASPMELVGIGLVLAFSAFTVFYASSMPVHIFDPIYHFAYKGKLLLHEGLLMESWTDVEGPIGRVITHPDYPPGVGALEAFLGALAGGFDEDATRPLFALFVLATTAVLWSGLRRAGRLAAVTGTLLWSTMPFLFYSRLPHPELGKGIFGLFAGPAAGEARFGSTGGQDKWSMPDGWTLDGAGDLPLAALFSVGMLLLVTHLHRAPAARRRGDLVLAGLLLGGSALMKNEGLALLPIAALALGLAELLRSRLVPRVKLLPGVVAIGTALLVALVVAGPWLAVRGDVPTIGEDYPSRLSPAGLAEAWGSTQPILTDVEGEEPAVRRVPAIVLTGFTDALVSVPRFGLAWLLFGAALVLALLRPRRLATSPALPAALAVLGAFALYALVLLVTPWNLSHLFKTAIPDRLIFHVAPLAVFAAALLLTGYAAPNEPDETTPPDDPDPP